MEVIGTIASVIAIIETTSKSYKAIRAIRDLPEAFDTVGQQLQRVRRLLSQIQEKSQCDEGSTLNRARDDELRLAVEECRSKAEALRKIFQQLEEKCNKFEQSALVWKDRFKNNYKAILKGIKANRVEILMADLWKGIERLAVIKIIGMDDSVQRDAKGAIEDLEEVEPSVDDSEFDAGGLQATQQIYAGATGTQNNVSGKKNIINSGNLPGDFAGSRFENFHYGESIAPVTERIKDVLFELKVTDYDTHLSSTQRHLDGTCQWFRQHPGFKQWLNGREGLLLISASAGCGKSVLTKYLIETLLHEICPEATVCYFFFKETDSEARSFLNASRSFLHRLLGQFANSNPALAEICLNRFPSKPNKVKGLSPGTLWSIFEQMSRQHDAGEIICVLDALDESDPEMLNSFVAYLKDYINTNAKALGAKFIITTRGYPQIVSLFHGFPSSRVHLDGDNDEEKTQIQKEINLVMIDRLKRLKNEKPELGEGSLRAIEDGIVSIGQEQKTYLWMHLMFDYILAGADCTSVKDWEELFRTPLDTVNQVYEKLLRSVKEASKERVRTLLALIVSARRYLTVSELSTAVGARTARLNSRDFTLNDVLEEQEFKHWALRQCGSFITIYDGKVYLIHQTAKEFLLGTGGAEIDQWQGSMTEQVTHRYMAESCISLLSLDEFRDTRLIGKVKDLTNRSYPYSWKAMKDKEKIFGHFTEYAAVSWLLSFNKCQRWDSSSNEIKDIGDQFVQPYISLFTRKGRGRQGRPILRGNLDQMWYFVMLASRPVKIFRGYKGSRLESPPRRPTGDYRRLSSRSLNVSRLACLFNHYRLLKLCLEEDQFGNFHPEVNDFVVSDSSKRFPELPHFAAFGGSSMCLQYLGEKEYKLDLQDAEGQTPLHQAMSVQNEQAIETLLGFGTSMQTEDSAGRIPIVLGMLRERPCSWIEQYVSELQDDRDEMGSLLFSAARAEVPLTDSTHLPISSLKTMLEQDWWPEHNVKSFRLISPLHFLHRCGADLGFRDENGLTALHISAEKQSRIFNTIYLLQDDRVDVNAVDKCGNTPLHTAAVAGNTYGVQLLMMRGADVNCRGQNGDTPLDMARKHAHFQIVEYLSKAYAKSGIIESERPRQLGPKYTPQQDYVYQLMMLIEKNGRRLDEYREGERNT